tara:strand:+ start:188 stop:427 length:240 start_codon:yes stop_codon:yes gene_type:complete
MEIKVHNFITDGDNKQVTLEICYNDKIFYSTKNIAISDGKTLEQYVSEAVNASQDEIDEWKSDTESIGKYFDPEKGTFV